jgi:uncharacterized protein
MRWGRDHNPYNEREIFHMKFQKAIHAFQEQLRQQFGGALYKTIIFGSVARNESDEDSDIDVLIVLDRPGMSITWETEYLIRSIAYDFELEYDVVFDLKVIDFSMLNQIEGHTPFIETVFRQGVEV